MLILTLKALNALVIDCHGYQLRRRLAGHRERGPSADGRDSDSSSSLRYRTNKHPARLRPSGLRAGNAKNSVFPRSSGSINPTNRNFSAMRVKLPGRSCANNLGLCCSLARSSPGMRSSQRECESFSWSEKSRADQSCGSRQRRISEDPGPFFLPDLCLPLEPAFAFRVLRQRPLRNHRQATAGFPLRFEFQLQPRFLSRRNPCFHPSIRWRACWATSSFFRQIQKLKRNVPCTFSIGGHNLPCQVGRQVGYSWLLNTGSETGVVLCE